MKETNEALRSICNMLQILCYLQIGVVLLLVVLLTRLSR